MNYCLYFVFLFWFFIKLKFKFFWRIFLQSLIIDFSYISRTSRSKYINRISSFVIALIDNSKLLNNYYVSKIINNWVDIIFGERQLPNNYEDIYINVVIFIKNLTMKKKWFREGTNAIWIKNAIK